MMATNSRASEKPVMRTSSEGLGFTVSLTRVNCMPAEDNGLDVMGAQELMHTNQSGSSRLPLVEGPGALKAHLRNADNYAYLIQFGVGNQTFRAILDTGSSDLWVVESGCADQDCERLPKYQPTHALNTTGQRFHLQYLTANVSGVIAFETASFGQFEVVSQALALVNQTQNMGLTSARASGVLGLAFPYEAAIPQSVGRTLLENIFAHLDPINRFFAFKLSAGYDSTFSVGELDPAFSIRSSDILYSPVYVSPGERYDYWKLQLHAITINGKYVPNALSPSKLRDSRRPVAVLDTGTTLVLGPSKDVEAFWAAVGGAKLGDDGRWRVKCEHAVLVGFVLGNETVQREFVLDPADISWRATGRKGEEGWCVGGIQSNDGVFSGDWLLGDVFLRNVYVVHQASSSSTPPLIGLLSTTNGSTALHQFQSLRGNDTVQTPGISSGISIGQGQTSSLNPIVLLILSGLLATVGSTTLAALIRIICIKLLQRRDQHMRIVKKELKC